MGRIIERGENGGGPRSSLQTFSNRFLFRTSVGFQCGAFPGWITSKNDLAGRLDVPTNSPSRRSKLFEVILSALVALLARWRSFPKVMAAL